MTAPDLPLSPRRSRPEQVAATIKEWIVEQGMSPGDRLPNEAELIGTFGMAKGTIREAMRLLQAEGLVVTRPGPGGGTFLRETTQDRANALLSNYFYFQDLSVDDIYAVRLLLEPELAAALAGKLDTDQIDALKTVMMDYAEPARDSAEERLQHIASLRFHATLASYSDNRLLGFFIGFMSQILTDLTVFRKLYTEPNLPLWQQGRAHQIDLIAALQSGDAPRARQIMHAHMQFARGLMDRQEAMVSRRFLRS